MRPIDAEGRESTYPFGPLDVVGSILRQIAADPNIDPKISEVFRQIKRDDIDEFDVPDEDGGSWRDE